MDFSKLKAFIVVAEELNFRKSAEILGMSQPPLTRLIASLEKEMGAKLFERSTRSVKLTAAGIVLLREAREIAAAISRIENEVHAAGRLKSGTLRIAFSRTAFMARFLELVEEFKSRFSNVKLDLQEDFCKNIIKGVQEKRYDLGFVEAISMAPGLESHEIDAKNLGVLVPTKHPLAKKSEIQFHDLRDETVILHSRKEAEEFYDRISELLKGVNKKPKIYIKGPDESCPILVATGKGISLTIAGSQAIVPRHTRFIPIKDLFLPVRAFWRSQNNTPELNTFLSFMAENQTVVPGKTGCLYYSAGI